MLYIEDKNGIEVVINQLSKILHVIRDNISFEDYDVILFLLSVYNNRKNNIHLSTNISTKRFIYEILQDGKYEIVSKLYIDKFKGLSENKFIEIISILNDINSDVLKLNFQYIFDQFLYNILNSERRISGEYIQPLELSRFIINIANLENYAKVYNPFAGLVSYATFLNKDQYFYGQELNPKIWALGILRLYAYNLNNFSFNIEDSIENWNNSIKYDLIVSSPPLTNLKNDISIESFVIDNYIKTCSETSQLILFLSQSFLYKNSTSQKNYKQQLVENNLIDTIISLPSGILTNTSLSTCIIIFKKTPSKKGFIRFIDSSNYLEYSYDRKRKVLDDFALLNAINIENEDCVKYVDFKTIKKNKYDLSVERYFLNEIENGVKLKDILTLINSSKFSDINVGKFVKIKDLRNDVVNFKLDIDSIETKQFNPITSKKIEQNCLLLTTIWKTLKPTYFKYTGIPIFISNDIIALNVDENRVNVNYLINELYEKYVEKQLEKYRIKAIIPILKREDLFNIKIELPSIEIQNLRYFSKAEEHIKNIFAESNKVFYETKLTIEDENSFLRHQIAGSLKNIRGSFKFIKKILEEQVKPSIPNLDNLKADIKLETTLSNYLNIIERDLKLINNAVNKAGNKIDLLDLNIENFDLLQFLREYVESLKIRSNNFYKVTLDIDENMMRENEINAIMIQGDKDIIRKMFDNIIENAEKHAFSNIINNGNKIKIELLYDFIDSNVQIDISNTGKPLSENLTFESIIRKGYTSGINAGDGVGIWYVNEVMKIHHGKFGYTDETSLEGIDSEYVTTIELTFPITHVK